VSPDTEPSGAAIPPSIALAWGVRERPRRGPRPGLSLERIVAAGITVALTEGLGAVSMARVAAELGVGTMSLYRYVKAKDELLALMVDTALGPPPPPADAADDDWRAALTRGAVALRATYQRNLWILRVPISSPPLGPNNVAWLEVVLRALASTPLSEAEKAETGLLVSQFVRSEVTLAADVAAASAEGSPALSYGALLGRLADPLRFPAIHRAIAGGAFENENDPDAYFTYGLGRILDGVEKLARSSQRRTSPRQDPTRGTRRRPAG
jgi:AcrR family transcriptional regulator